MLAPLLRRIARQQPVDPLYRLFRQVYYQCVDPLLDYGRQVSVRSPYRNIYYCCTQRTASQWFKHVLRDPIVYRYTGLKIFEYNELGLHQARLAGPLPAGTICTHLYIGQPTYVALAKPGRYRTFFILRDPRDVSVSWYFAARYSHGPVGPIPELRKELEKLSLQEGLRCSISSLDRLGLFWVQRSWLTIPQELRDAEVFRYEEFVGDSRSFLHRLFDYLEIPLPADSFATLYDRYEFKKLAGGRERGSEDPHNHYRKGIAGDWRNYFDQGLCRYFRQVTGDLLEVLGYPA